MDRYGQYVKGPGGNVTEVRGVLASANVEKAKARPAKRPSGEPNIGATGRRSRW